MTKVVACAILKKNVRRVTMKEKTLKVSRETIAKAAGVTTTTVTCVLNNTRPVSEKTRLKVLKAIEELNYVPDLAARAMLGKGSRQICVVVENLVNPFFAELVSSIETAGKEKGYFVSICCRIDLKKYVAHFIARKIDAVYFCSEIKEEEKIYIRQLLDNGVKVLTSLRFHHYTDEISRIDMATGKAVMDAVDYLVEKGFEKIGFITTFDENSHKDDRLDSYIERIKHHGLKPCYVSPSQTLSATIDNGKLLFDELLNKYKDIEAVIGMNDIVAIGAMTRAKEIGIEVPEDISFIGIDGIEMASLVTPKLTTFKSNASKLGHRAFDIITNMIENNKVEVYNHEMILQEGNSVKDKK